MTARFFGLDLQHTYIETNSVRYIYQPLEDLFVVVITNKTSNILEDLETLRLLGTVPLRLAKLVKEECSTCDEATVEATKFELVFAFDEVVSLGYKEPVTLSSIQTYLAMDSHTERMHDLDVAEQGCLLLTSRTGCKRRNGKTTGRNEETYGYIRGANEEPGWPIRFRWRPVARPCKPAISTIRRTPTSCCPSLRYGPAIHCKPVQMRPRVCRWPKRLAHKPR